MIPYRELVEKIHDTDTSTYEAASGAASSGGGTRRRSRRLIFVFLGIGFGTVRTRAVRAGAALTSLVILLAYWGLLTVGTIAVQKATLPAFLAMDLGNIVFACVGALAYRRAMW